MKAVILDPKAADMSLREYLSKLHEVMKALITYYPGNPNIYRKADMSLRSFFGNVTPWGGFR